MPYGATVDALDLSHLILVIRHCVTSDLENAVQVFTEVKLSLFYTTYVI